MSTIFDAIENYSHTSLHVDIGKNSASFDEVPASLKAGLDNFISPENDCYVDIKVDTFEVWSDGIYEQDGSIVITIKPSPNSQRAQDASEKLSGLLAKEKDAAALKRTNEEIKRLLAQKQHLETRLSQ